MKKTSRLAALGALGILASVSLAACGGDDGGSSADASGEIKLVTIAPVSTNLQNYPDAEAGAKAAVDALNEAGGIDGKQISWSFCNTESDPNKAAACVRQADTDGAVAIVGQVDVFSTNTSPLLEAAKLPSIGFQSFGNPIDWVSPAHYPLQGGAPVAYMAAPHGLAQQGSQRVAVAYTDVAASVSEAAMVEQAVEENGMEFAGNIAIPASGVSDYSPFAQQIKDSEADAVVLITSSAYTGPLLKAAKSLGVDPTWVHNAFSIGEAELTSFGSDAEKMMIVSPFPTYHETDIPAIEQFLEELTASGAEDDPILRRSTGINAWLSVHATAQVIEGIDGEITRESVTEALDSSGEIDLFGLMVWNPSDLGTNEHFPRFPNADERFLNMVDGQLVTMDLEHDTDPLAGITPSS